MLFIPDRVTTSADLGLTPAEATAAAHANANVRSEIGGEMFFFFVVNGLQNII